VSITKIKRLTLFKEITAVYSEISMKRIKDISLEVLFAANLGLQGKTNIQIT
jgi:hypothetical protein